MSQQVPVDPSARADDHQDGKLYIVAPDLTYQRLAIVNVLFYGPPNAGDREWVLIDAGISGMASQIVEAAEQRFGAKHAEPFEIFERRALRRVPLPPARMIPFIQPPRRLGARAGEAEHLSLPVRGAAA